MSDDHKARVKKSLERYYEKLEADDNPYNPSRNEKPEKDTEKEVLKWCADHSWDVDVFEAKAKFNVESMLYSGRAASVGASDIIGNTDIGLSVYIELKAKGKRIGSALREQQRKFLTRKITSGSFAIMCDSVEYLEATWLQFCSLPTREEKIKFLLNELPVHKPRQLKFDEGIF